MSTLATTIATILSWLRAAVAARASARRELEPLLVLTYAYLGRTARRLDRLVALWLAGRVPAVRVRRAAAGRGQAGERRVRLPSRKGWLLGVVIESRGMASQLDHAMQQPEFTRFLEEVPQAGRILRPLCRMLGLVVPKRGVVAAERVRSEPVARVLVGDAVDPCEAAARVGVVLFSTV